MTTDVLPKLRPLSLAELLDQAIRLYRRSFLKLIGIVAVVYIPLTLVTQLAPLLLLGSTWTQMQDMTAPAPDVDPQELFDSDYFTRLAIVMGLALVVGVVSLVLTYGAMTPALAQATAYSYLGRPIGLTEAYRKLRPHWRRLLGTSLFVMGVLAFTIVAFILMGMLQIIPCLGCLAALLLTVIGTGPVIYLWLVIVPVATLIVVLERQNILRATRRAWALTRRRFWWVIGFVVVLFLFNQVVVAGPTFLISLVLSFFQNTFLETADPTLYLAIQTAIQSLTTAVFGTVYVALRLTGLTLMYIDLRVRTEGFDLALMATDVSDEEASVETLMAQAPSDTTSLITWSDIGRFLLLSIGVIVLIVALYAVAALIGYAVMGASGGLLPGY